MTARSGSLHLIPCKASSSRRMRREQYCRRREISSWSMATERTISGLAHYEMGCSGRGDRSSRLTQYQKNRWDARSIPSWKIAQERFGLVQQGRGYFASGRVCLPNTTVAITQDLPSDLRSPRFLKIVRGESGPPERCDSKRDVWCAASMEML